MDILQTDDIQQLKKLAKSMGVRVDTGDDIDRIKTKVAAMLGDLGYTDSNEMIGDDIKEKAKENAIAQIMSGKVEFGCLSAYPSELKPGKLPKLLPFQHPWEGRRRRVKRIQMSENDQQILFIHWNGYPFVMGLEAEYADMPYPHFLTIASATSNKLRQKKIVDDQGRANWKNEFFEIKSFPIQDMGVTPGTEHLPRSMKEYLYSAYVEGFPAFTPQMWKVVAQAYNFSDKTLGITPLMGGPQQVKTRRMAVLNQLNIQDIGDTKAKRESRAEIIAEILSESPIAEAA